MSCLNGGNCILRVITSTLGGALSRNEADRSNEYTLLSVPIRPEPAALPRFRPLPCFSGHLRTQFHSKFAAVTLHDARQIQFLDRLGRWPGRGGGMRDDPAEILFQSFLQNAFVSSTGMGRDVHSFMLSIQLDKINYCLNRYPHWFFVLLSTNEQTDMRL